MAYIASDQPARMLLPTHLDTDNADPFAVAIHIMSRKYLESWMRDTAKNAETLPLSSGRLLQAPYTMEVTFQDCLFLENIQGPTDVAGIPLFGIVSIISPFSPTVFRNSRFERNRYDGSGGSQNGFAIQSTGSPLEVHDCCFEDNSFIGFGPIQAIAGAPFEASNNYITEDDLVVCRFAALSELYAPDVFEHVDCVNDDLLSCGGALRPPFSETMAPTPSETYVPPVEQPILLSHNPTATPTLTTMVPTNTNQTLAPVVNETLPTASPSIATAATSSPSNSSEKLPTVTPTRPNRSKTLLPTPVPFETFTPTATPGQQILTFTGLEMMLKGAPELTPESLRAFEEASEKFYRSVNISAI